MVELDQKRNHTNFVANNILIVPHFDPKDMDPYAQLQRLVLLEERMRALEESQRANKIELIMQGDSLRKMKQSVDTHETIITSGELPKPPSYADMAGSRGNKGNSNRQTRAGHSQSTSSKGNERKSGTQTGSVQGSGRQALK